MFSIRRGVANARRSLGTGESLFSRHVSAAERAPLLILTDEPHFPIKS